ncbi:protein MICRORCHIDIA 4 [Citrus sinensis]|nr:protein MICRORCHIDIA 4 [Citrus sinensis]
MNVNVKREILETCLTTAEPKQNDSVSNKLVPFIELSSSSESNSGSDSDDVNEDAEGAGDKSGRPNKRRKMPQDLEVVLPVGFLEPLPAPERLPGAAGNDKAVSVGLQSCKQFWKAGDYEGAPSGGWEFSTGGMDHVRVHPKFLHSNATSHKWALGAFAELLDNSLDEVCNGATYSNIDMLINRKDGSRMLLIEDNGGGMNPDKMRHCMSLGYSAKSKAANTIGQYGNGFKTSTMRLGADVIVFSCCCGKDGKSPTRSIGLLSYTFLRSTGKEDIVVPMLDYEGSQQEWKKIIRSSLDDWNRNVETIVQWSPFSSEADLLHQSYASILYLRLPPGFRIIIRGKDVEHHNIVNDMMLSKKVTYRPQPGASGIPTDLHMAVDVTIGFVKDAKHHIDVQGFNVYHKNRLIKPFWRLWNASGSDGRGVIGVLEANFVEPAHDKQGFERTTVLARLEARLIQMQKDYWNNNCHEIGYAPRRYKKYIKDSYDREISSKKSYPSRHKITDSSHSDKHQLHSNQRWEGKDSKRLPEASNYGDRKGHESSKGKYKMKTPVKYREGASVSEPLSPSAEDASDDDMHVMVTARGANGSSQKILAAEKSFGKDGLHRTHPSACLVDSESQQDGASGGSSVRPFMPSQSKGSEVNYPEHFLSDCSLGANLGQLKQENHELKKRLEKKEGELQEERERCRSLEAQLKVMQQTIEELNKEQESLIDIFAEERDRREREEENLRKKIKDASDTIQDLLDKIKLLEKMKTPSIRAGH